MAALPKRRSRQLACLLADYKSDDYATASGPSAIRPATGRGDPISDDANEPYAALPPINVRSGAGRRHSRRLAARDPMAQQENPVDTDLAGDQLAQAPIATSTIIPPHQSTTRRAVPRRSARLIEHPDSSEGDGTECRFTNALPGSPSSASTTAEAEIQTDRTPRRSARQAPSQAGTPTNADALARTAAAYRVRYPTTRHADTEFPISDHGAITGSFARKAEYVFAIIVLGTHYTGFELTLYRAALMHKVTWTKVSSGPSEESEEEAMESWLLQMRSGDFGDTAM